MSHIPTGEITPQILPIPEKPRLKTMECQILNQQINALLEEIRDLQCCGNCQHFIYCKTDGSIYCELDFFPFPVKGVCDRWQFDGKKVR